MFKFIFKSRFVDINKNDLFNKKIISIPILRKNQVDNNNLHTTNEINI